MIYRVISKLSRFFGIFYDFSQRIFKRRVLGYQHYDFLPNRVLSVRDIAFAENHLEVKYSSKFHSINALDYAGLFLLDNLILHCETGALLFQPSKLHPPSLLLESGVDDFHFALKRSSRYRNIFKFKKSAIDERRYQEPVFVFENYKRKNNYYHFLIDSFPRLLIAVQNWPEPLRILHTPEMPRFALNYLGLVSKIYGCNVEPMPTQGHLKISSKSLVIGDISKKYFGDFPGHISANFDRFLIAKMSLNLCPSGKQVVRGIANHRSIPRTWVISDENSEYRFPNGAIGNLPSVNGMESIKAFGNLVTSGNGNKAAVGNKVTFVIRSPTESRGRIIENQDEIIEHFNNLDPCDFAQVSLEQQIRVSQNSKIMIGLTGAGLSNCVFMRKGACLIHLHPLGSHVPENELFLSVCEAAGVHCIIVTLDPFKGEKRIAYLPVKLLKSALSLADDIIASEKNPSVRFLRSAD